MPSYTCEKCNERMTLQKAAGKKKMDCPTCGCSHGMKKDTGSGMIDESVFGF